MKTALAFSFAAISLVLLAVSPVRADLVPTGDPVFGTSLSQTATGTLGQPYVGHRIVAPSGFNGAYIDSMSGVGAPVPGAAQYELRDDFGGGSVSQLVEGWWNLNGSNLFTTTLEIADPLTFPSVNPADYVGLKVQCALARADRTYHVSREWVFTNGADPSTIAGIGSPTGGGSWVSWNHGWYLSPLHYDGSAWTGSPVPVPGAIVLGLMGLGLVGWLQRRRKRG